MSFPASTIGAEPVNPAQILSNVSHDAQVKLYMLLDTKSLVNLMRVNHALEEHICSDPYFWRDRVIQDFGKKTVSELENRNSRYEPDYREVYIKNYVLTKHFLAELPNSELLKVVQDGDIKHAGMEYGILIPQNFDQYIASLSDKLLSDVFVKCVVMEFMPLMEAIKNSPRFSNLISLNIFKRAFLAASANGKIRAMNLIMSAKEFKESTAYDAETLARSFVFAADSGHTEAMQLILTLPGFKRIAATGEYGIGRAFKGAAKFGHIKAMKLIISLEAYKNIPANGENSLGDALNETAKDGRTDAINLILTLDKSSEISPEELGKALVNSASFSQPENTEIFIRNPELLSKIKTKDIKGAIYGVPLSVKLSLMEELQKRCFL